jgi:hypothetical protein
MEARIRIIKRDAGSDTSSLPANQSEKTEREREREMAKNVKGWVAEWEERNRSLKNAALSLVHSLNDRRRSSAVSVMVNG